MFTFTNPIYKTKSVQTEGQNSPKDWRFSSTVSWYQVYKHLVLNLRRQYCLTNLMYWRV